MPLPKKLQDKWDEADKTNDPVDIGNIVVCDICNEDYTNSLDSGGFIFTSSAYCPKCAKAGLLTIQSYGEERYIKAMCKEGQSFADFVREYRGGNNIIHIRNWKQALSREDLR